MPIQITLIVQFLGMFVAAKALNLNVNFIGILLLTAIPTSVIYLSPGLLGFFLALVSLIGLVKLFDGSASFIKIVAILVISLSMQAAFYKYLVSPLIPKVTKNGQTTIVETGDLTLTIEVVGDPR